LENQPYGRILHTKYLTLKSSLQITLLCLQDTKDALNYQKNMRNILKLFSAVSSTVVNSMILIVSRGPIRLMKRETIMMMKICTTNNNNKSMWTLGQHATRFGIATLL